VPIRSYAMQKTVQTGVKIRRIDMSRRIAPCPRCGEVGNRHSVATRKINEIGLSRPVVLEIKISKHYCKTCKKHFNSPVDHIASPFAKFSKRAHKTAVDLVVHKNYTMAKSRDEMWSKYHVRIPVSTIHDWIVAEMKTKTDE
jgi:transposase